MVIDPSTTKYMIKANIKTEGIVEKPDVVGAIFGQTEGLIGDELDLRDLQKSGRIGRIEVSVSTKKGKSEGSITIPSCLDQVETAILGSALETIDRVGPCKAKIDIDAIEDVRASKRKKIIDRARQLLGDMIEESKHVGIDLTDTVREAVQVEVITSYGTEKLPAGPNVEASDNIIVVEGRSDVLNLLKYGIKNAVAVEGTSVPKTIEELTKEKNAIAFVDGDRGGQLILRELLEITEIDFVARAPKGREVEELSQKQIMKALRNKIPSEQYIEMYNITLSRSEEESKDEKVDKAKKGGKGKKDNSKDTGDKLELTPQLKSYKKILDDLEGKTKATLLDAKDKALKEIPIRELRDQIGNKSLKIQTIVFDGIITQQLVDLAASSGVKTIVGLKKSNVSKQPSGISLYTKNELDQ